MRPDNMPRPFAPDDAPQPVSLMVPIHNMSEVDLMGALDFVVGHFIAPDGIRLDDEPTPASVSRAVDWLHARFGSQKAT